MMIHSFKIVFAIVSAEISFNISQRKNRSMIVSKYLSVWQVVKWENLALELLKIPIDDFVCKANSLYQFKV